MFFAYIFSIYNHIYVGYIYLHMFFIYIYIYLKICIYIYICMYIYIYIYMYHIFQKCQMIYGRHRALQGFTQQSHVYKASVIWTYGKKISVSVYRELIGVALVTWEVYHFDPYPPSSNQPKFGHCFNQILQLQFNSSHLSHPLHICIKYVSQKDAKDDIFIS